MKSLIMNMITASVLAATLMLAGTFAFTSIQKANAQMGSGNMTGRGGMMRMMASPGPNITGSLKLSTIMGNAIAPQIKVSLSQSAMAAEEAVGNNSHAVAAHFGVENGYLVYSVWLVDGSYNFHKVIVDAGNGKVLFNQPVSKVKSMMMHGMMMRGDGTMMQHGPSMSSPWHKG